MDTHLPFFRSQKLTLCLSSAIFTFEESPPFQYQNGRSLFHLSKTDLCLQVPITFSPREVGSYSQFWELKTQSEGTLHTSTETTKLELVGKVSFN